MTSVHVLLGIGWASKVCYIRIFSGYSFVVAIGSCFIQLLFMLVTILFVLARCDIILNEAKIDALRINIFLIQMINKPHSDCMLLHCVIIKWYQH